MLRISIVLLLYFIIYSMQLTINIIPFAHCADPLRKLRHCGSCCSSFILSFPLSSFVCLSHHIRSLSPISCVRSLSLFLLFVDSFVELFVGTGELVSQVAFVSFVSASHFGRSVQSVFLSHCCRLTSAAFFGLNFSVCTVPVPLLKFLFAKVFFHTSQKLKIKPFFLYEGRKEGVITVCITALIKNNFKYN